MVARTLTRLSGWRRSHQLVHQRGWTVSLGVGLDTMAPILCRRENPTLPNFVWRMRGTNSDSGLPLIYLFLPFCPAGERKLILDCRYRRQLGELP
ncbi:hypothetical protein I7I48_01266 [Histoplasma ohiense]|nr:hypothetical protein I7I48_01266 [Histoplasma ohiense (nom. inval.)]